MVSESELYPKKFLIASSTIMSSPAKPWENSSRMSSVGDSMCDLSNDIGIGQEAGFASEKLCSSSASKLVTLTQAAEPSLGAPAPAPAPPVIRPEIPPRNYTPMQTQMQMQNAAYGPYAPRYPYASTRLPYSGYSMYGQGYGSGYPPYYPAGGYGFNSYNGGLNSTESRFIRAAEESTRPTFQAIESITRAINSIAFMMESTFGSLNTSFQAVLSVIENFSYARTLLKQFFASVITFRIFHKFFLMLVGILKRLNLISEHTATRVLWQNVQQDQLASGVAATTTNGISMWPMFTFLGLMLGAPYFISKMLPAEEKMKTEKDWNPMVDRYIPLIGVHDFQAANEKEISFQRGDCLRMIPPEMYQAASQYWVFVANEKYQTGFVPRNHVAPA